MRKVELLPTRDCEAAYGPDDMNVLRHAKLAERFTPRPGS